MERGGEEEEEDLEGKYEWKYVKKGDYYYETQPRSLSLSSENGQWDIVPIIDRHCS